LQLGSFKILASPKTAAHGHTAQQLNQQSSLKYSPLQKPRHTGTQLFYSIMQLSSFKILARPKTAAHGHTAQQLNQQSSLKYFAPPKTAAPWHTAQQLNQY
jgi:hypothetical protein